MADRFLDPRSEWILRHTIIPFIKALWRPTLVDNGCFPEGPCFIYGNHSNNLDPFILNVFTRNGDPTSGVMTQEYLKKGAIGWLMRGIGLLGTRKQVPEPHLIKKIYQRLDAGRAVVIYPEGGRRW
ncbi:MAG TPA: 1-acyl-sn-glycerol-3-phosphate acyltransferase, partial [Rhodothermales bacterium]|nr:1-acyl-sn-glycerol-3-phosphate acyltransferase [Rhodothermales bacterium]